MPELPEVEVVRRGLQPAVFGATVRAVEVRDGRALKRHAGDALDFVDRIEGAVLGEPQRRGKFLWIPFDADFALMAHLGMSGQLLVRPVGSLDERQLRVRMRIERGGGALELRFSDQRLFGSLAVDRLLPSDDGELLPSQVGHIARDPLDPAFDVDAVVQRLRASGRNIKALILDQQLVSGVGNIYADEALWRARLYWGRPGRSISVAKLRALLGHVEQVFQDALAEGGTSFDALYVNVNGESGYFSRSLHVYGRQGEPCDRCGTAIVREKFMNRSSYFCPRCQRGR
ncbi:bifunctional DNA-formamidopyrimidine glycosylase/DNA-(apurinic or apyrimidinic site) lyase [Gulosibacter sediminis]|uniref:bifunctional DNA-formamidopyrimidine glycosylase/DNA-(apurinic or apyrimidinic site) lyase n=1 Tax=Gulosibacter sediminis TaxID=1729695 RepID=UPI0024ACF729|nr:bifunctional DNA-formamidopyrimidine glycosylase/DNA-(apurinic or apyrimidinic site) lyase [Gulosibacter sediminis]